MGGNDAELLDVTFGYADCRERISTQVIPETYQTDNPKLAEPIAELRTIQTAFRFSNQLWLANTKISQCKRSFSTSESTSWHLRDGSGYGILRISSERRHLVCFCSR